MRISILTICPEQFGDFQRTPLISRAVRSGLLELEIVDIRDYAPGSFRAVDDSPYGGGAGMILRCQPVLDALEDRKGPKSHVVILAPIGKTLDQETCHRLSGEEHIIFICGHYEGMDARIYSFADEMISIGDYILTGGELPAMVITDSVMRLVEGSMKAESVQEESFENGLLEYPQYTRPAEYKGMKVPDILLSGDHGAIEKWRREEALRITRELRPDLLEANMSEKNIDITELGNPARPMGEYGKIMLEGMNERHAPVTEWALKFLTGTSLAGSVNLLDIGCGGGATLRRLAFIAPEGTVYGIDYSEVSVAESTGFNKDLISQGRVKVLSGSVESLPFNDDTFDTITTVESFYFWPDPQENLKEVYRVLKPGGKFLLIADIYGGADMDEDELENIRKYDLFNPTPDEFRELFENAGFNVINIHLEDGQKWICAEGGKSIS